MNPAANSSIEQGVISSENFRSSSPTFIHPIQWVSPIGASLCFGKGESRFQQSGSWTQPDWVPPISNAERRLFDRRIMNSPPCMYFRQPWSSVVLIGVQRLHKLFRAQNPPYKSYPSIFSFHPNPDNTHLAFASIFT